MMGMHPQAGMGIGCMFPGMQGVSNPMGNAPVTVTQATAVPGVQVMQAACTPQVNARAACAETVTQAPALASTMGNAPSAQATQCLSNPQMKMNSLSNTAKSFACTEDYQEEDIHEDDSDAAAEDDDDQVCILVQGNANNCGIYKPGVCKVSLSTCTTLTLGVQKICQ